MSRSFSSYPETPPPHPNTTLQALSERLASFSRVIFITRHKPRKMLMNQGSATVRADTSDHLLGMWRVSKFMNAMAYRECVTDYCPWTIMAGSRVTIWFLTTLTQLTSVPIYTEADWLNYGFMEKCLQCG